MVPGRVLPIGALPLTVNGKLDRKALTERGRTGQTPAVVSDAVGDSVLAALVGIFAETLSDAAVDGDTDFFRAGGDSIVAITVINRARSLGLPIAPRDVFLFRTPRALAEHLGTRTPHTPPTAASTPAPPRGRPPDTDADHPAPAGTRRIARPVRPGQDAGGPRGHRSGRRRARGERRRGRAPGPPAARLRVEHGVWALRTQ